MFDLIMSSEHRGVSNLELFRRRGEIVQKDPGIDFKLIFDSIMLLPKATSPPTTLFTVPAKVPIGLKIRGIFLGPGIFYHSWKLRSLLIILCMGLVHSAFIEHASIIDPG